MDSFQLSSVNGYPCFNTSQESPTLEPFHRLVNKRIITAAYKFDLYFTPIICLFGILGNFLSILVFLTKSHKSRGSLSSSVYLSALAMSDTGFLLNVLILWLDNMGINLLNNRIICPTVMYLGQVTGFLSVWLVVAFTVERFFAVCYPLSRATRFTVSRAKKLTGALTISAILVFSYVLVIAQVLPINVEKDGNGNESFTSITNSVKTSFCNESMVYSKESSQPASNQLSTIFHSPTRLINTSDDFYMLEEPGLNRNKNKSSSSKEKEDLISPAVVDEIDIVYACTVPEKYTNISQIYNNLDALLTFIIPFFLIAFLNMRIIFCVKMFKSKRDLMVATTNRYSPQSKRSFCLRKPKPPTFVRNSGSGDESHKLKHLLTQGKKSRRKKLFHNFSGQTGKILLESHSLSLPGCSCSTFTYHNTSSRTYSTSNTSKDFSGRDIEETQFGPEGAQNSKHQRAKSNSKRCCEDISIYPGSETKNVDNFNGDGSGDSGTGTFSGNSKCRTSPPIDKVIRKNNETSTSESRVTKTLFLVSSVFLLLHFPSHVIRVASFIQSSYYGSSEVNTSLFAIQLWANFLFNLNFSVNFLLYCFSGKGFRQSVWILLKCRARKDPSVLRSRNHNSTTTNTPFSTNIQLAPLNSHGEEVRATWKRQKNICSGRPVHV